MKPLKPFWSFLLLAFVLTSCSDKTELTLYEPKIIENGEAPSTMPNHLREIFLNFTYQPGIIPVACYVDSIRPFLETGSYADDLFDAIDEQTIGQEDFSKRGMLVLISESPRLIQIRMGSKYRTYCNLTGVTSGIEYLSLQQRLKEEDFANVLPDFLQEVNVRVSELNSLPWYKKMRINQAVGFVSDFLDYAGTPSENFYGKWILKPILSVMSYLSHIFNGFFWSILLALTFLLFVRFLLIGMLKRVVPNNTVLILTIINFLLGLLFSISVAGAAVILSGGRMEDIIALHAFGIPYVESLVEAVSDFSIGTSTVTIVCFVILFTLKLTLGSEMFLLSLYPASIQRAKFKAENPYFRAIRTGLHQADMQKVENSPTPYSEMFQEGAGKSLGTNGVSLTLAALFMLPQTVLYVGIALALNDLLKIFLRVRLVLNDPSVKASDRPDQKTSLWVNVGIIVAFTLLILIIAPLLNPMPDRQEIKHSPNASQVIDIAMLPGNYTWEESVEGHFDYGSAVIKKQSDNVYTLLVTGNYDPKIFTLNYDTKQAVFYCEPLGKGIIHYDRELNTIQITFKIQNATWTLSK